MAYGQTSFSFSFCFLKFCFCCYQPITNTAWIRASLCKLQKGCTRLAAASDKVYQLFAHGRWFSPGIPASSTTKTGCHDIAEILLNVALKHQKSINQTLSYGICFNSELSWSYCSWIYYYICNQCISPLTLQCRIPLIDYVIKFVRDLWQVGGFLRVFRFPPPITNKTDRHDITEILLKASLTS